jgi:hypothetical protein
VLDILCPSSNFFFTTGSLTSAKMINSFKRFRILLKRVSFAPGPPLTAGSCSSRFFILNCCVSMSLIFSCRSSSRNLRAS